MTTTLHIDGMSCDHCVKRVTRTLEKVPGVSVVEVRLGAAAIEHAAPDQAAAAVRALDEAGYPAHLPAADGASA
jgi:copper chaperone CopZ